MHYGRAHRAILFVVTAIGNGGVSQILRSKQQNRTAVLNSGRRFLHLELSSGGARAVVRVSFLIHCDGRPTS